jgi:hypothetical protein
MTQSESSGAVSEQPRHVYLYLLLTQVAYTVLYPIIGDALRLTILLEIFLLAALVGGVLPSIANRRGLLVTSVLALLFLLTRWSGILLDIVNLIPLSALFAAAFFSYVTVVLIRHIFLDSDRVDADLICGAISVYLLIGVTFGFAYVCLNALAPGSFSGVEAGLARPQELVRDFNYFSFVTLTTLGYGDITPQSYQAGVLAYLEAIVGQVYLAVLVARLVGMHIAQKSV